MANNMLISTMYHNINSDKYSNDLELFEQHLIYIKEHFNIITPDDKLAKNNICLTFDDAFYNFYHYVFPLLQKYNIKAILAVPTQYILKDTNIANKDRLSISHDDTYYNIDKAPFCTFKELKIMSDSGLVKIASHSHSHINLNETTNLEYELKHSKELLQKHLNIVCDIFIFPFGKYNDEVLKYTKKYYKYLFRIGNGINKDFNGIKGVIYRVNADGLKDKKDIFSFKNMLKYKIKSFIKSF
jgi:peptidoglycan/xylan/chitin deacetylase (PgdA/CDA1 family)